MKKTIIIICFLFVGCGASMIGGLRGDYYDSQINEKNDEFENRSRVSVTLSSPSFSDMAEKAIRFERVKSGRSEPLYIMYSYIYTGSWLFIDTAKIKLNDKMYTFNSIGNDRNVLSGSYIEERNVYNVTKNFIYEMAKAENVSIRLYGKSLYMDIEYKDEHRKLLNEFLQRTK